MNKVRRFIVALLAVVLVFTGTNALATIRYCNLDNVKTVTSTNSCTAKNNQYFVAASHGATSKSNKLSVGWEEWSSTYKAYKSKSLYSLSKGTYDSGRQNSGYGTWAKLVLTASGSTGSGRGSISNEF